jgi:hypothetical protein
MKIWNLPGVAEKNYEKSVRIAGILADIRTHHLLNTGLGCSLWITLLGAHIVDLNINYFTGN